MTDAGAGSAPRVDGRTKLVYGLGDIPNAVKTILAGLFGLYFYTSVMGLSGTMFGIAAVIGLVWDAVIDPYIGYLSDRSRSRLGRRHGFMLIGALTMGLGFWASFSPPRGLSGAGLFAWLLATGFVARTAISMYRVPYFALGAELSSDYHERTSITGIRGMLAVAGTLIAAGSVFVVFFPNRTAGVDPKLDYDGYWAMGLAFGLLMTSLGLVTTLGTLRWSSRPQLDAEPGVRRPPGEFFASAFRTLSNPSFRRLLASACLFFLAVAINGSLSLHFLTHYVEITDSKALSAFQVASYVGGALGLVFWLRVSRRIEKHRLYVTGSLGTAAVTLSAYLLLGDGNVLGNDVIAVTIIQALGGFCASIAWFLPATMIADIIDEDELATGERREGSFFGCFSLVQQLALGMSLLLAGLLLDGFVKMAPAQAGQSVETARRIGVLYCLVPTALLVLAGVVMLRYDLGRRRIEAIQAQLAGCRPTPATDR